jgi:hypothetical protein
LQRELASRADCDGLVTPPALDYQTKKIEASRTAKRMECAATSAKRRSRQASARLLQIEKLRELVARVTFPMGARAYAPETPFTICDHRADN